MSSHSSATVREQTPHANQTRTNTIINALKRRAQALLIDKSIDPQSRAIIRYALEVNDPWLARLVRRADAGEAIVDMFDSTDISKMSKDDETEAKIEALTEMICRAGDEPETKSAALFVLMATVENSAHPEELVNVAKHSAFNRCAELNRHGIVDAQVELMERELFAG